MTRARSDPESRRDCQRLQTVRGSSHGKVDTIFPEVRERPVRLVLEQTTEHTSQWGAVRSVAEKIGCTKETLRRWVRQAEPDAGYRPGLTTDEQTQVKLLEGEVRELRRANEILRKASAYFAQAELDRRGM
jgi:transposase